MSEIGSTLPRRQLGRYLRDLRTETGMTIPEVAKLLQRSSSTVQRFERGEFPQKIRIVDIRELCHVLGAGDTMTKALTGLAEQANVKSWWHEFGNLIPEDFNVYMGLESVARQVTAYSSDAVIGLLQTAEYARVLTRDGYPDGSKEEIERLVYLRQRRQALLTRKRHPAKLSAVLGEAALRRVVGNRKVMAAQHKHLADVSTLPNITLRILPFEAGIPMGNALGRFINLDFGVDAKGEPVEPSIVYLETFTGDLYLEKPTDVDRYHEAYRAIQRAALDEQASRSLLRTVAREFAA